MGSSFKASSETVGSGISQPTAPTSIKHTQPDGSPTVYPKMRENLRLLGSGSPTKGGSTTVNEFAFKQLNGAVGRKLFGVDL